MPIVLLSEPPHRPHDRYLWLLIRNPVAHLAVLLVLAGVLPLAIVLSIASLSDGAAWSPAISIPPALGSVWLAHGVAISHARWMRWEAWRHRVYIDGIISRDVN
jgi:hypothetical protein